MLKLLSIAWKDLTITFRDRAALITMLFTPFAISLAVAAAFGGTGGGGATAGLSNIPLVIVNNDSGSFGQQLIDIFGSPDLADLVEPQVLTDEAAARAQLADTNTAAVIVIPADFSAHLTAAPQPSSPALAPGVVAVYLNVNRPIGAGVIRDIVNQSLARMNAGAALVQVASQQLLENGLVAPSELGAAMPALAERAGGLAQSASLVRLEAQSAAGQERTEFNWLAYMAPSMAIMFLMFTVMNGGRSLLTERESGTLARLLTTPTAIGQIIGGKLVGIFLIGLAQVAILLLASYFIMGVSWSSLPGVVLVTLALVAAATSWGMLLAAYARTPAQAGSVGSAVALIFAGVSGNFVPRQSLPESIRTISYISPNSWGLEAYSTLTSGGGLRDVVTPILALATMTLVLFLASALAFRRQYA